MSLSCFGVSWLSLANYFLIQEYISFWSHSIYQSCSTTWQRTCYVRCSWRGTQVSFFFCSSDCNLRPQYHVNWSFDHFLLWVFRQRPCHHASQDSRDLTPPPLTPLQRLAEKALKGIQFQLVGEGINHSALLASSVERRAIIRTIKLTLASGSSLTTECGVGHDGEVTEPSAHTKLVLKLLRE